MTKIPKAGSTKLYPCMDGSRLAKKISLQLQLDTGQIVVFSAWMTGATKRKDGSIHAWVKAQYVEPPAHTLEPGATPTMADLLQALSARAHNELICAREGFADLNEARRWARGARAELRKQLDAPAYS